MKHNKYKRFVFINFLFCYMSMTPAIGYIVGQNLIIKNNTHTPMIIKIQKPNNQGGLIKQIPALRTVDIYFENGDKSGWLYQFTQAPFTIIDKNTGVEYVNGNVSFYVGSAYSQKYSFLNEVKAGEGITLETAYSCENGGNGVSFQNQISIDGTPQSKVARLTKSRTCNGLQSSSLESGTYRFVCHNYEFGQSTKKPVHLRSTLGDWPDSCFWGGYRFHYCSNVPKQVLDEKIGNKYCHTTNF